MKKIIIKILTLVLAFTSLFALTLFAGCDCNGSEGGGVIPKPEEQVERYFNLDTNELSLIVGDEHAFRPSYKREEGKTITYTSSNPDVASVNENGELVAIKDGTTKITATYGDLSDECTVGVSFGNFLPELTFESGVLEVYNIGLDGTPYTFNPTIKFNNKYFTDVEVTYEIANDSIAKIEGASITALTLGETTITINASWRGFTVDEVPALQKVVKVKTHNVADFLINGRYDDVIELSSFNGDFEGNTYSNSQDFKVSVVYNGKPIEGNNVGIEIEDTSTVSLQGEKLVANEFGKTSITLTYNNGKEEFASTIMVDVVRPVADSGKKFFYFSAAHGYYKDPENNYKNTSIIKEIFGNEASKVVDAQTLEGKVLTVSGDKVLNVPVKSNDALLNTIVIGTSTYAYSCVVESYGAILASKEDLQVLNVGYTFDKAKYDAMPDSTLKQKAAKVAYLEACEADPFTHIDGYVMLVNDIDATGVTITHDAVVKTPVKSIKYKDAQGKEASYDFINGEIGFLADEANNKFVALNKDASITYNGKTYNIPRAGYPVVGSFIEVKDDATSDNGKYYNMHHSGYTASFFKKIGLLGTFDGQGHIIYNFTSDETKVYYKDGAKESSSVRNGAGLLGVINSGAVIKGVAVQNFSGKGSVFAYLDQNPMAFGSSSHNFNTGDIWDAKNSYGTAPQPKDRTLFENIYVYSETDVAYGVLYGYTRGSRGSNVVNSLINLPKAKELKGNGAYDKVVTAFMGGSVSYNQTNTSLCPLATNVYVVIPGERTFAGNLVDGLGIVVDSSLKGVYSKTETIKGVKTPAIAFALGGKSFWGTIDIDASGNIGAGDAVYWNGLYGYSYYNVTTEDIELSKNVTSAQAGLVDLFGKPVNASKFEVKFSNPDALKYENGAIKINTYISGNHTATFIIDDAEIEVPVFVEIIKDQTAYLSQLDGEIVFPYLTKDEINEFSGQPITVDNISTTLNIVDGKAYIDLNRLGVDTTKTIKETSYKNAVIGSGANKNYFALNYVTKAIDEASDFSELSIGFTFDEKEYNALTSDSARQAYLQKCQDQPYTYYDGYYVLVKDIDFDANGDGKQDYEIKHAAAVTANKAVGGEYVALDHFALTYDSKGEFKISSSVVDNHKANCEKGVITVGGKSYLFPHIRTLEGATKPSAWLVTNLYTATALNVGFKGTFDGQGHIIYNLDTTQKTLYEESVGIVTATGYGLRKYTGDGLFGIIGEGAVIKNFALSNVNLDKTPALATINVAPASGKSNTTFENIYISDERAHEDFYGALFLIGRYRTPIINNVVINIPNATIGAANGFLNKIGNTPFDNSIDYAKQTVTNLYIATKNPEKLTWGVNENNETVKHSFVDVTVATDMAGLFGATVNDHGTSKTMAESFANNEYFEVINGGVYFKGMYKNFIGLVDDKGNSVDSVFFTQDSQSATVTVADANGTVDGFTVDVSNTNGVLEYVDGELRVVEGRYALGEYEVTFTYGDYFTKTIIVSLSGDAVEAYLQTNGELVGTGLTDISEVTFTINKNPIDASLDENGKIMLDLTNAGITTKPGATDGVINTVKVFTRDVMYNCKYVDLAIDEATDFSALSADFTFDQATYEGLVEAGDLQALKDYLQACQDQAYTYFDGYAVLVKDIDFAGVNIAEVIPHYAATTMSKKYAQNGAYPYYALDRAPLTYDPATNTYSLVEKATWDICKEATIKLSDGSEYTFPRVGKTSSGAKAIWLVNNLNTAYNTGAAYQLKAGFMGTFDGQGHVISNLNTQYVDQSLAFAGIKASNTEASQVGISKRVGSGLFGIIGENALIKNFALNNVNLEGAPAFATVLNARTSGNTNITFENIYVSDEETNSTGNFYGTFYIIGKYRTPKLNNVVINIPNIEVTTANTFVNGTYGGAHTHFGNDTARQSVTNLYIATKNPEQLTWGINNKGNSTKVASIDVTVATDMAGLFSATANDHGTSKTMADSFDGNDCFEVINGGVYFKGMYKNFIGLVDADGKKVDGLEFTKDSQSITVGIADGKGFVENTVDVSNTNGVLEYVDGELRVVEGNYVPGDYEVTFTYGEYLTKTIKVTLNYTIVEAYLQSNGELVGTGLTDISEATFTINKNPIDASLDENGKIMLDLTNAGITTKPGATDGVINTVKVEMAEVIYNCKYVDLAIDEATDFSALSADFTFDQATYEGLVEAGDLDALKAYLQACQDQAYTYFDGYAVLVKDIDFAGVNIAEVIPHYAATTMSKKYADNGAYPYYSLDRAPLAYAPATNTYSLANKATWPICLEATIKLSDGSEYTFPRVGKTSDGAETIWLVNNLSAAYSATATNPLKAGFMGTFDGQGYVISNLNTQYVDQSFAFAGIKASDKETGQIAMSKRVGSGLFGIITEGAVIKNFALENVNLEGAPAFATVLNARTSSTSNITFENIYISDEEVNGTGNFYGTFYFIGRYRTPKLNNVVIDLTNITVTTENTFINGTFGGSDLNCKTYTAQNHFTGKTARQTVTNLYIATKNTDKLTWVGEDGTSYKSASIDVTFATDMAGLFSATVNDHEDDANMGELLANNYWAFVDANGNETYDKGEVVYWHSLVPAIPQA